VRVNGGRTLRPAPGEGRALLLAAAACVVVAIGWSVFWFLTDDAFIAFRYVSNSQLGFGYTWNPPPFRPVEGYSSFLWVVLLDLVWRVAGVEPPVSANLLSLFFACGSVCVTALVAWRMDLTGPMVRWRPLAISFVLAMVVTNRTFLTWTSSGLETALFNFLTLAWLFVFLYADGAPRTWVFTVSLLAALAHLARPEGVVFVAATVCGLGVAFRDGALWIGTQYRNVPNEADGWHMKIDRKTGKILEITESGRSHHVLNINRSGELLSGARPDIAWWFHEAK
jgi:arabinofuranosyltransferase